MMHSNYLFSDISKIYNIITYILYNYIFEMEPVFDKEDEFDIMTS